MTRTGQWCERAAVTELVLIPVVQTKVSRSGDLKPGKPAVTAWACEQHAAIRDREPGAPPKTAPPQGHRRKAARHLRRAPGRVSA